MPVPLKIILTPAATDTCNRCGYLRPCIRFDLFSGVAAGSTDPLCLGCLGSGEQIIGEIDLHETAEETSLSRRPALRRQKRLSQKQEIEIATALGGYVQPASGSLPGAKGDGRRKDVLRFEAKFTQANSFQLQLDELYKIASECHGRERPVLVLDFKEKTTGKLRDRFAVVRFEDVKEMFDAVSDNR